MDTKQIEYILKIAEEGNITHAAEKLFLTQPALNQQLLRLEKELGTRLFVRSRTDWRPTEAGMVYLENARKMPTASLATWSPTRGDACPSASRLVVESICSLRFTQDSTKSSLMWP